MPTLHEHSSEEAAATEVIFNVHRRGANWTQTSDLASPSDEHIK
jgi:hypothetical protein